MCDKYFALGLISQKKDLSRMILQFVFFQSVQIFIPQLPIIHKLWLLGGLKSGVNWDVTHFSGYFSFIQFSVSIFHLKWGNWGIEGDDCVYACGQLGEDVRVLKEVRFCVVGCVALHEAAKHGCKECIKTLLAMGAPSCPRNSLWETPVDLARKEHEDCYSLLGKPTHPFIFTVFNIQYIIKTIGKQSKVSISFNKSAVLIKIGLEIHLLDCVFKMYSTRNVKYIFTPSALERIFKIFSLKYNNFFILFFFHCSRENTFALLIHNDQLQYAITSHTYPMVLETHTWKVKVWWHTELRSCYPFHVSIWGRWHWPQRPNAVGTTILISQSPVPDSTLFLMTQWTTDRLCLSMIYQATIMVMWSEEWPGNGSWDLPWQLMGTFSSVRVLERVAYMSSPSLPTTVSLTMRLPPR